MSERAYRYPIRWVAWGDRPPYAHHRVAWLTWRQCQRFERLQITDSLLGAYDYAIKVSRPAATDNGRAIVLRPPN